MDNVSQKKSKKWIVYTGIIVFLALLFAFGPVFFARYMRSRDGDMTQELKKITTRMKVKGTLNLSEDNKLYLLGTNSNVYLIVGSFVDELKEHVGELVTVMGPMQSPQGTKVDGQDVRLVLIVDKYGIPDIETDNLSEEQKNKINNRRQFVDEINAKLKKTVRFDAVKGTIELEKKNIDGTERNFQVIKDTFGDMYVLLGSNGNIASLLDLNRGKEVICLGKPTIVGSIPLTKDEVIFEVFEIYDENLNKIK
ncbi:MAG: hypothetical protein K5622_02925 [Endomicrobiaceae bacterium]|nr:hypothetical protein [Endomicrobiaceae bacterium]